MDFDFIPFEPDAALRPFLRRSFHARGRIPYRFDKILPNGLAVAIFNKGASHQVGKCERPDSNPSFAHSWLHGVQTSPVFNAPGGETHVLGLLFEPIGLHALFGIDMSTLTDRTVDARDVLPDDFVAAIEQASNDTHRAESHAAIRTDLLARRPAIVMPRWLTSLYQDIQSRNGRLSLADAYAEIGLSARHVSARFKTAVGVSPKVLCRIYRLNALLTEIDPAMPVSWTTLAHGRDFFDQAHFNHEFRRFSGLSPRNYLEQRRRDLPQLGKGESVSFAPQR